MDVKTILIILLLVLDAIELVVICFIDRRYNKLQTEFVNVVDTHNAMVQKIFVEEVTGDGSFLKESGAGKGKGRGDGQGRGKKGD